ncbi:MAG: Sec-independent protein translocase protein TatB [Burkholderiales bacterium]
MFDIGFSELAVIGVVALVVIGPERLPRVARTAGHLLGRFQRYVTQVRTDISREMDLADLKKIQTEVESAAKGIESSVTATFGEAQKDLAGAGEEIKKAGEAIQQTASGLNLTAGWPYQPASSDAVTEAAPAEPKTSQLELGLDTSAGADSRKA